jgi:hypothetical protein
MAKTKCIYGCGRFAKHYSPPRCRQCVSGRKPGRPVGLVEKHWRVSRVRRRPETLDKMVDAEARARFGDAA